VDQPRGPGQRAGLTRDLVLGHARTLLSERGLEALTMRALAQRLGVRPNALYSHVQSKTALVDELLDDTLAEVEAPADLRIDPGDGLRMLMASTYEVLLAHPDLVPLYLARQGARGPNAQRLGEIMLALLERAGLDASAALDARRVLIIYTIGYAAFTTRPPFESEPQPGTTQDRRMQSSFGAGLHWLLSGIIRSG
jgi:TetR/AcrR family transcriptional regulator, tetracycline repressor protein